MIQDLLLNNVQVHRSRIMFAESALDMDGTVFTVVDFKKVPGTPWNQFGLPDILA